jgi:hypothetical protein
MRLAEALRLGWQLVASGTDDEPLWLARRHRDGIVDEIQARSEAELLQRIEGVPDQRRGAELYVENPAVTRGVSTGR